MVAIFNQDWTNLRRHAKNYGEEVGEGIEVGEGKKDEKDQKEELKGEPIVPIELMKEGDGCSVCLMEASLFSSGMCEHRYCRNCWKEYIKSELQAGRIFFGCMHEDPCPQAPILPNFVSLMAPELH